MLDADNQADIKPTVKEARAQIYSWNLAVETIDWIINTKAELKWSKRDHTNTKILVDNPLKTGDSTVKVVMVEPSDPHMKLGIQKLYRERYLLGEIEIVEHHKGMRQAHQVDLYTTSTQEATTTNVHLWSHEALDCESEEYCPICQETGHKIRTTKCPAFKATLEEADSERERGNHQAQLIELT
ncbi:hypothetical protein JTB14_029334 [Gonioctena quinquepunctata]|nr:hypothetical protein JTB14_029334 [Gonioctena quinquepunctata]